MASSRTSSREELSSSPLGREGGVMRRGKWWRMKGKEGGLAGFIPCRAAYGAPGPARKRGRAAAAHWVRGAALLRVRTKAPRFGGKCGVGDARLGVHGRVQSHPPATRRNSRGVARSRPCSRGRGKSCPRAGVIGKVSPSTTGRPWPPEREHGAASVAVFRVTRSSPVGGRFCCRTRRGAR
jgi:hypothetical protein